MTTISNNSQFTLSFNYAILLQLNMYISTTKMQGDGTLTCIHSISSPNKEAVKKPKTSKKKKKNM